MSRCYKRLLGARCIVDTSRLPLVPMRHYLISVLSVLTAGSLHALTTALPPRWGDMREKHAWNTVPENWVCLGHPPAGTTIDLHIALKSQNESALIDALYEVSDPGHPKYGAHLSKEQVAELVAPHKDTLKLVSSWLEHNGVSSSMISMTHGGNWLTVSNVHVSKANDVLGASYKLYRHTAANLNSTVVRTISYGLPEELHTHVQTVVPTTYFGSPRTLRQSSRMRNDSLRAVDDTPEKEASEELVKTLSSRDEYVTPSFLRWLYKTSGYAPAAAGQNAVGVAGFLGDYPSQDDLRLFMNEFRTDGADATYGVTQINDGVYGSSNPHSEANGNVQYTAAITYPTPLIYYSTGGASNVQDPFVNWLKYLLIQKHVPQAIGLSYGTWEQAIPLHLANALCFMFAQLGARGVSVLVATGDDGVGPGDCKDTSGNVHFLPAFPASCPWVTAVGGTTGHGPEVAASLSGGGFSHYFVRPRYQEDAVHTFLKSVDSEYDGFYWASGRGLPDISAQALRFALVFNRKVRFYEGTSLSAPIMAGVISLLNDYRISKGNAPLGFLNPWLYSKGSSGFNDITFGSNPGCDTVGFSAVAGWDPVTGLGTPNFDKLEEILDEE